MDALKIIAVISAGIFAVVGAAFEKRDESRKLTRSGWAIIVGAVVSALVSVSLQAMELKQSRLATAQAKSAAERSQNQLATITTQTALAAELQGQNISRTEKIQKGLEATLAGQEAMLVEQKHTELHVIRAKYPLEPLTLSYEKEYSIAQPVLRAYMDRVRPLIAAFFRGERQGRGVTRDDMKGEKFMVRLNSNHGWEPDKESEWRAWEQVTTDNSEFVLKDDKGKSIVFVCDAGLDGVIVTHSEKGRIAVSVETYADFNRDVLVKRVVCHNPLRVGDDGLAKSVIDLVGRSVTWESSGDYANGPNAKWRLKSLALRFSYDYDVEDARRVIDTGGKTRVSLPAAALGLEDVGGLLPSK